MSSSWIRKDKRLAIHLRDGLSCQYCGSTVEDGASLTLDHVHPRNGGGGNESTNLVTCCLSCNSSKQDTPLRTWAAGRGLDASTIAARVRVVTRRNLKGYLAQARQIMGERG